jgi:hypothetical protein
MDPHSSARGILSSMITPALLSFAQLGEAIPRRHSGDAVAILRACGTEWQTGRVCADA